VPAGFEASSSNSRGGNKSSKAPEIERYEAVRATVSQHATLFAALTDLSKGQAAPTLATGAPPQARDHTRQS
jgi:hypothetical protein